MSDNHNDTRKLGKPDYNDSSRKGEMTSLSKCLLSLEKRYEYGEKDNLFKAENSPINTLLKCHSNTENYTNMVYKKIAV
ncbi:hypothetical protein COBT_000645 [Conglomerata obtusa]